MPTTVDEDLDFHLANAIATVHGTSGADLLAAVATGRAALSPTLGDGATHDAVASAAYAFARDFKPAAAASSSSPIATKPSVVSEKMFRDRFGDAALKFGATDRIALARTLASELGIAATPAADRFRPAPVTRGEMQAHFGSATNLDTLSARVRLSAANEILAARAKATTA